MKAGGLVQACGIMDDTERLIQIYVKGHHDDQVLIDEAAHGWDRCVERIQRVYARWVPIKNWCFDFLFLCPVKRARGAFAVTIGDVG